MNASIGSMAWVAGGGAGAPPAGGGPKGGLARGGGVNRVGWCGRDRVKGGLGWGGRGGGVSAAGGL